MHVYQGFNDQVGPINNPKERNNPLLKKSKFNPHIHISGEMLNCHWEQGDGEEHFILILIEIYAIEEKLM